MSDAIQDPIQYFLEDIEHHGRNIRTTAAYKRVLREYERFLEATAGIDPVDAEYRDCMRWIHQLREEHGDSTIATYASYLNRFYGYHVRLGHLEENPMTVVLEEMGETIETNPSRRDISVPEMGRFVRTIHHPLHQAVIVTLLKTGLRAGELCNLDLMDLHLAEETMDWHPRAQIAARPQSLFVSPEHAYGRESNGEVRTASNKRKRETVIPIDEELDRILRRWLAIRPDVTGSPQPVFTGTVERWGERITPDIVHHIVETHAREAGWYRTGGGPAENVTPHYFRHFFTTHLRDRTGDRGIVKYLRGDVAEDIIDTYTHDWGNRVRETYLEHVYTVF